MSKYTKEDIEKAVKSLLEEALESVNRDCGIISVEYISEKNECLVRTNVFICEEDDFIGIEGY